MLCVKILSKKPVLMRRPEVHHDPMTWCFKWISQGLLFRTNWQTHALNVKRCQAFCSCTAIVLCQFFSPVSASSLMFESVIYMNGRNFSWSTQAVKLVLFTALPWSKMDITYILKQCGRYSAVKTKIYALHTSMQFLSAIWKTCKFF